MAQVGPLLLYRMLYPTSLPYAQYPMKLMSRKGRAPMRYMKGRVLVIMLRTGGALTVAYTRAHNIVNNLKPVRHQCYTGTPGVP